MILTPEQLVELTRAKRSDAQRRELDHLGIPYRVRRDGSVVVAEADVPQRGANAPTASPEPELT